MTTEVDRVLCPCGCNRPAARGVYIVWSHWHERIAVWREDGLTWAAIAARVGVSARTCRRIAEWAR